MSASKGSKGIREKMTKAGIRYEARFRRKGAPESSRLFEKRKEAETWLAEQITDANRGQSVIRPKKSFTIREALLAYIAEVDQATPRLAWADDKIRYLRTLVADLGEIGISRMTGEAIKEYFKRLAKKPVKAPANKKKTHPIYNGDQVRLYSESTMRKIYFSLKQGLEWHARKNRYVLDPHLFSEMKAPAAWAGQRNRRLEGDEEALLLAACDQCRIHREEWKRLIRFALLTAMRNQEMIKAEWAHVNWEGKSLHIPGKNVKTRKEREIPLTREILAILLAQRKACPKDEPRIFWSWKDPRVVSKRFRAIAVRAGMRDLKLHDLRHEATTRLSEQRDETGRATLDVLECMQITGHTQMSTIRRYTHHLPSRLAEQMDRATPRRTQAQPPDLPDGP